MSPTIPLGSVALSLAAAGFAVFPLLPGAKGPATRRGFHDSTRDYSRIRDWWEAGPAFNIGIDCGKSGITVIDADPLDPPTPGHETGLDNLLDLADSLGVTRDWLWAGPQVSTPRGGYHLYFRTPPERRIPSKAGHPVAKIDVRASGAYVVAPWSALTKGPDRTAGHYRPMGWDHTVHAMSDLNTVTAPLMAKCDVTPDSLPVLPTWLADQIDPPATPPDPWQQLDRAMATQPIHSNGYGAAALAREADEVAATTEGSRNHRLNAAAFRLGQLVAAGRLVETDVITALDRAGATAGLDQRERLITIRSGLRGGLANPREVSIT